MSEMHHHLQETDGCQPDKPTHADRRIIDVRFVDLTDPAVLRRVLEIGAAAFAHVHPPAQFAPVVMGRQPDLQLSLAAMIEGKVVGGYVLSKRNLPTQFDAAWANGLAGLCGEALMVAPAHRGRGIGHLLRQAPAQIPGFDYLWGQQARNLNNLSAWLKRRHHVAAFPGHHVTLEAFDPTLHATLTDWAARQRQVWAGTDLHLRRPALELTQISPDGQALVHKLKQAIARKQAQTEPNDDLPTP
jgi:GNAT superfamily N-acetyltransferase